MARRRRRPPRRPGLNWPEHGPLTLYRSIRAPPRAARRRSCGSWVVPPLTPRPGRSKPDRAPSLCLHRSVPPCKPGQGSAGADELPAVPRAALPERHACRPNPPGELEYTCSAVPTPADVAREQGKRATDHRPVHRRLEPRPRGAEVRSHRRKQHPRPCCRRDHRVGPIACVSERTERRLITRGSGRCAPRAMAFNSRRCSIAASGRRLPR